MNAITVVDYDPAWPRLFAEQRRRLTAVIGDLAENVYHVGSTSIAGLCAKPKIDIDAVLHSDASIAEAIERMKSVPDYTFQGDPYSDGMWTFTQGHGSYGARLYICGPHNATHLKRILFRDWLRTHPADAGHYAALKRRLAAEANGNWEFYTGGKADFVASVVEQALATRLYVNFRTDEKCPATRAGQ